jgi:putative nucleotidyltransferase with HDIG domain
MLDTLNSLVTTIEAKDPYTRQHSHRVTEYAKEIAGLLEIKEEELEMIEFAGLLHDIGKIGVRDEILTKSGKLTAEEYDAIKQHVVIGDRIAEPLGLSASERAIIRNHHEWFNGAGYPDHLAGDQIPVLARIVTVADAFDAMTSTRPYRKALSKEEAMAELSRLRGVQFDSKIVDALIAGIGNGKIMYAPHDSDS